MRKWPIGLAPLSSLSFLSWAAPAYAQDSAGDAAAGLFGLGIGSIYCCCWGVVALLGIGALVLWIFMLVDCIQRENMQFPNANENTKTIWLVILLASWVFGLSWVAAIVYYFMVYRAMPRK